MVSVADENYTNEPINRIQDALLITSCGKSKIRKRGKIEAIERYNGKKHQSLRKYLRSASPYPGLQIIILSAKYGFINSDTPIAYYDLKMTKRIARQNKCKFLTQFEVLTRGRCYRKVMVDLGKDYQPALPDLKGLLSGNPKIEFAEGYYGERMRIVKEWLYDLK